MHPILNHHFTPKYDVTLFLKGFLAWVDADLN